jgi:putative PIN family toxin of toxin-antitoxin system
LKRFVFDPGVLISALISSQGAPAEALDRWREGEFDLVVSPALLDELRRVLLRRKFRRYATEEDVRMFVIALGQEAVAVDDPPPSSQRFTRDPDDDYLVLLARAAGAEAIVSGDPDLTTVTLDPPVVTPAEFLRLLASSG